MANVKHLDRAMKKAILRTANELMRKANTAISKKTREIYNIKANVLRKYVRLIKANSSNPTALIRIGGRPISLMNFGAKRVKGGVSVLIKKGNRKIVKGGFIGRNPFKAGGELVWKQTGDPARPMLSGPNKGKVRKPVKPLFTLAPSQMYKGVGEEELVKLIDKELHILLDRNLKFYMK